MSGRNIAILTLCLSLTACSGPFKLLTGGGPNVAANVQAGAENNQTLGVSNNNDLRLVRPKARSIEASTGETGVRAEEVQTVVVEAASDWVWVLISGLTMGFVFGYLLGWLMETPRAMMRAVMTRGRRNDRDGLQRN